MLSSKGFAYLGGAVVLCLIVYLVMPKERADQLADSFRRVAGDPGMRCLDHHRHSLKDPDTAKLLDSRSRDYGPYSKVEITYKAQNSYGAFMQGTFECVLGSDDSVNSLASFAKDSARQLEREEFCSKRKDEAKRERNPSPDAVYSNCIASSGQ